MTTDLTFQNFYRSGVRQGRQPPFWKLHFFQQFCKPRWGGVYSGGVSVVQRLQLLQVERTATHCNTHATDCNTLQHTASKLQHTATHCKQTATHCNALQLFGADLRRSRLQLLQVKYTATHVCRDIIHTCIWLGGGVTRRSRTAVFARKNSQKSML